jgi:hypothetical protein
LKAKTHIRQDAQDDPKATLGTRGKDRKPMSDKKHWMIPKLLLRQEVEIENPCQTRSTGWHQGKARMLL